MNKIFVGILVVTVLIFSCGRKTSMNEFHVFEMSKRNYVIQIEIGDVVEEVSVVKLESSSEIPVLGNIVDICETETSYYVQSQAVLYEYGKDGQFIRQVGAKGRGPGEYLYLRGLDVHDGKLFLFDFNTQSLLIYDTDGRFISSRTFDMSNDGIYFTSFFFSEGDMFFYSSSNAVKQDIFRYDFENNVLVSVSGRDRNMLVGELIAGENYIFGKKAKPYIYNNFNDTVYVLDNDRLAPSFLMEVGKHRYKYEDLFSIENMMNITESIISFQWIANAGNYVFMSYSLYIDDKNRSYIGLYNTLTNEYFQNVEFLQSQDIYTCISPSVKLYEAMAENELITIEAVSESEDEFAIIKYKVK